MLTELASSQGLPISANKNTICPVIFKFQIQNKNFQYKYTPNTKQDILPLKRIAYLKFRFNWELCILSGGCVCVCVCPQYLGGCVCVCPPQQCPTLCDPMDCSLPDISGNSPGKNTAVACPFSRGSY